MADATARRADMGSYRTISGILQMKWWLDNFSTPGNENPETGRPILTPAQQAEIVSILSAGTFFGALLAAPMADRIGRRKSLMVAIAVFSLGVALQTASMGIPLFVGGRYVYRRNWRNEANIL